MLEQSFPPLVSPQFLSETGLELSHNYLSLFKINISIDRGMAAVPTFLSGSFGFSEAHMCDNGTETHRKRQFNTEVLQLASIHTHSHFRF